MRSVSIVSVATIAGAVLAACNALTGADAFEVGEDEDRSAGSAPEAGPGSTRVEDGSAAPDAETSDVAPVLDAGVDVTTPDAAPVDAGPCVTTSVGPRYGASADGPWMNPNGIRAPDNQPTHTIGMTGPVVVTDFGFAIPASARIDGIKVDIARTTVGNVSDKEIKLPRGTAKANGAWPAGPIGGPYQTATYGGANDTWGTTWTAAEINAAAFGVSVSVNGNGDGHADSVGVTVTYCQ